MITLSREEFEKKYGVNLVRSSKPIKESFLKDAGRDVVETGKNVFNTFKSGGEEIVSDYKKSLRGERNPVKAGFDIAASTVGKISDVFGDVLTGAGKILLTQNKEDQIKKMVETGGEKLFATDSVQSLVNSYGMLSEDRKQDLRTSGDFLIALLDVVGLKGAKVLKKPIEELMGQGVGIAGDTLKQGVGLLGKVKGLMPESADIMNRVARLTPLQANKFKKLSGKNHGQYLTDTGNFGTPDKIIEREAIKFAQSIKDVDATLAKIEGQFKDGSVTDALEALAKKEKLTSSDNVLSPNSKRVAELQAKNTREGLTMTEINEVKRLFERNVRLSFNKMISPDNVTLATNIDNAIRKFQFDTAKDFGFNNLDVMNKQTQISKNLIDSMGEQLVGKTGLNGLGMGDLILLSGGDPTAVGAFLTKKFFGSKRFQAKMAKILAGNPSLKEVTPDFKETPLKRIGAGEKGSQMGSFTSETINLPENIRKQALGLEDVKNTILNRSDLMEELRIKEATIFTKLRNGSTLSKKEEDFLQSLLD